MQASLFEISNEREHEEVDAFLAHYDSYIRTLARKSLWKTRKDLSYSLLQMEIDELAQRTRIKLWQAMRQTHISRPKPYINRIIRHETVSMLRQKKRPESLKLNEEGELYQGEVLVAMNAGRGDPAYDLEQQESADHHLTWTIQALSRLAPRQRRAMMCLLKDKLDDDAAFLAACKDQGLDIDLAYWPAEHDDLHRLKACISSARKNMCALIS